MKFCEAVTISVFIFRKSLIILILLTISIFFVVASKMLKLFILPWQGGIRPLVILKKNRGGCGLCSNCYKHGDGGLLLEACFFIVLSLLIVLSNSRT